MADPAGWAEFRGVLEEWQRTPAKPQLPGLLVLMIGPRLAAMLASADPGAQLVPTPPGAGSYRLVNVHISGRSDGVWRLLEDGEEVASGEVEVHG